MRYLKDNNLRCKAELFIGIILNCPKFRIVLINLVLQKRANKSNEKDPTAKTHRISIKSKRESEIIESARWRRC